MELGKTDEETSTTKIKSGLSEDDYIAWADDTYKGRHEDNDGISNGNGW